MSTFYIEYNINVTMIVTRLATNVYIVVLALLIFLNLNKYTNNSAPITNTSPIINAVI